VDYAVPQGDNSIANPTITVGHGFLDDCEDDADWNIYTEGGIQNPSLTVLHDDYFMLEGACQDLAGELLRYTKTLSTQLPTATYTHFVARYKTSHASNGLGARIEVVYSDATTQSLLDTSGTPQFSIYWKAVSGTLATGKTITHIRIYADDYPNTVNSGTYQVYYDFILICKKCLSFPQQTGPISIMFPPFYARTPLVTRVGTHSQWMGADDTEIHLSGNMDTSDAWKDLNSTVGGYVYQLGHEGNSDPWQWFTSDLCKMKVTLDRPTLRQDPNVPAQLGYDLMLHEYRRSSGSNEEYYERFGLV